MLDITGEKSQRIEECVTVRLTGIITWNNRGLIIKVNILLRSKNLLEILEHQTSEYLTNKQNVGKYRYRHTGESTGFHSSTVRQEFIAPGLGGFELLPNLSFYILSVVILIPFCKIVLFL